MTDPSQPDPFDALFGADTPVAPAADFARQLHQQVLDALYDVASPLTATSRQSPQDVVHRTQEEDMPTETSTDQEPVVTDTKINAGSLHYFTIPAADPERAAAFYAPLFGWELHQGDRGFHVANVYPPMGIASNPEPTPQVWIEVEDIEAAVAKVRALGGTAEEPVLYDSGWSASCTDDQGVAFNLSIPRLEYRSPARRSSEDGELFYWTLPALDATRSKRFYAELFDWEFGTPGDQGGMHVENRMPDGGLGGGREGSHPELFFRVADVEAAAAKVRELGGTADLVGGGEEGQHAMCTDNQGVTFGMTQPGEGY